MNKYADKVVHKQVARMRLNPIYFVDLCPGRNGTLIFCFEKRISVPLPS
jgi:hypothetical protein